MPDNSNSIMHIIDIRNKATPSGWTEPAGTSNIAAKRVAWGNEDLFHAAGYSLIQRVRYRENPSGSTPFSDVTDGNDVYGSQALSDGHSQDSQANESGASDAKIIEYNPALGANPTIEDWSDKLRQVPLLGIVRPDANPTTGMLNDADSVDTDDVSLSTT